jgi:hypothetical protein
MNSLNATLSSNASVAVVGLGGMPGKVSAHLINEKADDLITPIVALTYAFDVAKDATILRRDGSTGPFNPKDQNPSHYVGDILTTPGIMELVKGRVQEHMKMIGTEVAPDLVAVIPTAKLTYFDSEGKKRGITTCPDIHFISRNPIVDTYLQINDRGVPGIPMDPNAIFGNCQQIAQAMPSILSKNISGKSFFRALMHFYGANTAEFVTRCHNNLFDMFEAIGAINELVAHEDSGFSTLRSKVIRDESGNLKRKAGTTKVPRFFLHELMRPTDMRVVNIMERDQGLRTMVTNNEIPHGMGKTTFSTPFPDDDVMDVMGGYSTTALVGNDWREERVAHLELHQVQQQAAAAAAYGAGSRARGASAAAGRRGRRGAAAQQEQPVATAPRGAVQQQAAAPAPTAMRGAPQQGQQAAPAGGGRRGRGRRNAPQQQQANVRGAAVPAVVDVIEFESVGQVSYVSYPRLGRTAPRVD